MSDWWRVTRRLEDLRIVIESVAEKSFLQTAKRRMCESRNTQRQGVVSVGAYVILTAVQGKR